MSDSEDDTDQVLTSGFGLTTQMNSFGNSSFGRLSESSATSTSETTETSEEEQEPLAKKARLDNMSGQTASTKNVPQYNDFAMKMMQKMGHKEGTGLGKNQQGITGIIEASKQRGLRGLGLEIKGLEHDENAEWDFATEQVTADESVEWMALNTDRLPDLDTMRSWVKVGKKIGVKEVPDTSDFCEDSLVRKVMDCKSVFDNLENEELRRARTKSNPFETIRGAIFQNRAAMKMANMDAILDFMFTNPKDAEGFPQLAPDELLYFADICAGPGGFSEYVLWRKKCTAKGFGFTLKNENDFKLHEFHAAASELFEPFYGVHGDGDIYRPDNLTSFREFVFKSTDGKGVHFVMADGGFDVSGMENLQEIRSNRLYLCQFLCALSILKSGGHFVCKLFDIFTNYSVGLIYLMSLAFKEISIFKPVTSRPANSERYIICKSKHEDTQDIHDYMFDINLRFEELNAGSVLAEKDIIEVVPLDIMRDNDVFCNYIIASNERLGEIQCLNLDKDKIRVFAKNPDLHDLKQADLREECLRRWQVPDQVRSAPPREDPGDRYERLTQKTEESVLFTSNRLLDQQGLKSIHSRYDYKFVVLGSEERFLIMSSGRSQVSMWNGLGHWRKVMFNDAEVKMELPRDTILEVEFVQELKGEGKGQRKMVAVHILDALVIFGKNIQDLSYEMRIMKARQFCKAIHRTTRSDLAALTVKQQFDLCDLHEYYQRLEDKRLKGMGPQPRTCYRVEQDKYFVPRGMMIVKIIKDPWMLAHSRSSGKIYYYNCMSKQALYEFPGDAKLSYSGHLRQRMVWFRQDPMLNLKLAKQCVTEDDITEYLSKLPP